MKFASGPEVPSVTYFNIIKLLGHFAVYYGPYWFWGAMGSETKHDSGTHGAYSLLEEKAVNRTSLHLSLWKAKPTSYFIAG